MGIFDKLLGKEVKLNPKSAFALAILTVIAADGQVDEEEFLYLRRLFKSDQSALETAIKVIKNGTSIRDCVPMIAATLDDKQKKVVMANLVDVAMADGVLAGAEKETLSLYLDAFKMSEADIAPIVETIALKNNSGVF